MNEFPTYELGERVRVTWDNIGWGVIVQCWDTPTYLIRFDRGNTLWTHPYWIAEREDEFDRAVREAREEHA